MSERPPCDLPGCEKPVEEFEPGQYRRYCTSAHRKVARKLRRDSEPLEEVEPASKVEPEPSPPADPVPAAVVAATNQQFDPDATTPIPRIPAGKSPPANPGRKPRGTVVAAPEPGLFRRRGLRPFASRGIRQGRGRPAPPLDPAQPDWLQPAAASTLPQEAEQHPQWVPEPQWVPVPQWTPTQWAPPPAQAPPPHSAAAPPAAPPRTGPPSTWPASTGWPQSDSAAPPVAPNPPAPASPPTPPVNDPQAEAAQAETAQAEAAKGEATRAQTEAAKAKVEAEKAEAARVKAEAARAKAEREKVEREKVEAAKTEAARVKAARAKADAAKAEAAKAEAAKVREAKAKAEREKVEAAKTEAARVKAARAKADAAKAEAAKAEAAKVREAKAKAEREKVEAAKTEAARVKAARAKADAAKAEAAKAEAAKVREAKAKAEREKVEAAKTEAARVKAARAKADAAKAEAARAEAAKLAAAKAKTDAEKAEAAKTEAARVAAEAAKTETARVKAAKAEAAKARLKAEAARRATVEAARVEAAKAEAARVKAEAEQADSARAEAAKGRAARAEAAKAEAAKAKADRAKADANKVEAAKAEAEAARVKAEAARDQAARDQTAKTQPVRKPGKAKRGKKSGGNQLDPSEVTAPIPRVVIPQQTPPAGQPSAPSWQSYANYPPMPSPPDEPAMGRRAQRAERRAEKHHRKAEKAVLNEQAAAVLSGAPIPGLPESPAAARRRRRREAQLAKPISLNPPAPAMWLGHMREALISALQSLANNRLRSLLTTIGIIAGVASVIMMVAMGDGMQKGVSDSFNKFATLITVTPVIDKMVTGKPAQLLTDKDYQALHDPDKAPDVVEYTSTVDSDSVVLAVGQKKISGPLEGVEHNYLNMDNRHIVAGKWFTQEQITGGVRQAILGSDTFKDLWGLGADPHEALGQTVRVGHNNFQIQGVLSANGQDDDQVLAPLLAARAFVVGNNGNKLGGIVARARDPASLNDAETEILTILDAQHHITDSSQRDYYLNDSTAQLEQQESFIKFLRLFIVAIASISLFVGGVGIANIMLVSVTERTREIGIRKAIGAPKRAIMRQFLSEAVMLTALGGLVGVALGIALCLAGKSFIPKLLPPDPASLTPTPLPILSIDPVLIAFGVSLLVGLLAGGYPAYRASRLRPIEALRFE